MFLLLMAYNVVTELNANDPNLKASSDVRCLFFVALYFCSPGLYLNNILFGNEHT